VDRWKIISKRRILLNVGASISLSLADKRTNFIAQDQLANQGVVRGRTMGYLFVWSSCVNADPESSAIPTNPACALAFESNRTYKYKVIQDVRKGNVYDDT